MTPLEEPRLPELPRRFRRPLAALWISLAVHAALLLFIQIAPSGGPVGSGTVLQARLEPVQAPVETPPAPESETPHQPSSTLVPTEIAGAAPTAQPLPPPQPALPPPVPAPAAVPPPAPPAEPARPAFALDTGVDLTYYTARELDKQAVPRREPDFAYPPEADRLRVSGSVRVQLKVEADGRVSDLDIIEGTPPGVFDESVLEAFRNVRFVPAQKGGRPVRALMLIEVTFDWKGRQENRSLPD